MKQEKEISERAALLGYRMKLAAEQAGVGKVELCREAVGVGAGTISRWWRGVQTPSLDDLTVYAQVMNKPVWWFYLDGSDDEFDVVAEQLHQIVDLAMQGRGIADSYRQVTGDGERFGRRERERLTAGTQPLRERISRETPAPWRDLAPDQQREVVAQLAAQALHAREE